VSDQAAIDRLRGICLDLPQATEKTAWGDPTVRVRDKILAMAKLGDGRTSVWLKALPGSQEMLIEAADRFFRPPYVVHKGWVDIRLYDGPDWPKVALHVRRSWSMTAPKKLAAMLEG